MMNSDPAADDADDTKTDAAMPTILRSGAIGAFALAAIAAASVVALWLAFYLLVFVPRAGAP
jgi:hypothetical protein